MSAYRPQESPFDDNPYEPPLETIGLERVVRSGEVPAPDKVLSFDKRYITRGVAPVSVLTTSALLTYQAYMVPEGSFSIAIILLPYLLMLCVLLAVTWYPVICATVDEVRDQGDALFIRWGTVSEIIPLEWIVNLDCLSFFNPRRITIQLRTPSYWGKDLHFLRFRFYGRVTVRDPMLDELIARIDRRRVAQAAVGALQVEDDSNRDRDADSTTNPVVKKELPDWMSRT